MHLWHLITLFSHKNIYHCMRLKKPIGRELVARRRVHQWYYVSWPWVGVRALALLQQSLCIVSCWLQLIQRHMLRKIDWAAWYSKIQFTYKNLVFKEGGLVVRDCHPIRLLQIVAYIEIKHVGTNLNTLIVISISDTRSDTCCHAW